MSIRKFERAGMLELLIALREWEGEKPPNKTELREIIKRRPETIDKCLETLQEAGLIEMSEQSVLPYEYSVWLTEKGKLIARQAVEMQQILEETHF